MSDSESDNEEIVSILSNINEIPKLCHSGILPTCLLNNTTCSLQNIGKFEIW